MKLSLAGFTQVFPFERMAKAAGLSVQRLGRERLQPFGKDCPHALKSCTGFSDQTAGGTSNGNIPHQMFFGIMTGPSFPITNYKIVSAICEMAAVLTLNSLRSAAHTGNLILRTVCMSDATYCEPYAFSYGHETSLRGSIECGFTQTYLASSALREAA